MGDPGLADHFRSEGQPASERYVKGWTLLEGSPPDLKHFLMIILTKKTQRYRGYYLQK